MFDLYTALMRSFAQAMELEYDFAVPEDPFTFEFEGRQYCIEPMPPGGDVLLYSFPGVLPAGGEDEGRKDLLAGNCFFRSTGGATLAAAPGNNQVILQKVIPVAGLEASGLIGEIEKFTVVTGFWCERLGGLAQAPEAGDAPAAAAKEGEGEGGGYIRV